MSLGEPQGSKIEREDEFAKQDLERIRASMSGIGCDMACADGDNTTLNVRRL